MDTTYSIAVKLGMETAGFAGAAGMATRLLGDIEGKASSADRALGKMATALTNSTGQGLAVFQKNLQAYTAQVDAAAAAHANLAMAMGGMTKLAVGAGLVGVGLAGVGVMKGWVSAASELQSAMAGVQLATLGVGSALQQASQLTTLQDMTYGVAAKTRFSAPDIANIEKIAATSGLNKRTDLISALPTLANAAEIALQLKGTGYQESVPAFVQMAHLFQAYGGKKFNSLLDLAGRASVVSGDTPATMENTLKYLIPSVNAYGLTPEDAISVAALASNVGLSGGKGGGSRIQAMFRSIAPLLSSRGALHNKALDKIEQLGGHQFFTHGNFEAAGGVTNLLTTVMRAMERIPDQAKRMALLNAAFGAAGGTAISSLASEGAVARFHAIQGDLRPNGIASTGQMQQTLNATWVGQTATLATNMRSLSAILGEQLLPVLTPIVHSVVTMTGALVDFLAHHRDVAQFVAVFTLVASTAALVVGGIVAVQGAVAIMGAVSVATGVSIGIAFGPITLAIVGITAAIAAGVWAWQHWGDIMRWARDHMVLLHNAIFALSVLIPPLGLAIGAGVLIFQHWGDITRTVGDALGALGTVIAPYVALLTPIVQLAGQLIGAFGQWISTTDLLKASMSQLTAPFVALGGMIHEVQVGLGNLVGAYNKLPAPLRAVIATGAQGAALSLLHNIPLVGGLFGQGGDDSGAASGGTPARSMITYQTTHAATAIHQATHATHHSAVVHNHHTAATIQQATHAAHPAVAHNHHTTTAAHHTMTQTSTARGGDVHQHIHVHPGAAAIHVHPSPTHDHRKIADEAAKAAGDHLGHHIANALRTSGVLPSTTRPTLHQLGMS